MLVENSYLNQGSNFAIIAYLIFKNFMKNIILDNVVVIFIFITCFLLIAECVHIRSTSYIGSHTLKRIEITRRVRLITDNSANTYYIYRDTPMGFEYDMAKEFAKFLHARLVVEVPGWNDMFSYLEENRGDFIAAGLTITEQREKKVDFSRPYMTIQQHLIHHKLISDIKDIYQLDGKTIHVRRGTTYETRLKELVKQGIKINIVLHDNIPTEELIRMVAERKIKYTVADSNIALLNRRYYPDIRIGIPIEEKENLGWATRKGDKRFLSEMNRFLKMAEKTGIQGKIYEKYYGTVEIFDYFDLKKFHERIDTRLPKYEALIKKEAAKYGFDWRMIAAVIYQESHYNADAISRTGVRGLMQVTLDTAREMEIKNRRNPAQSIKAGIKYLDVLYNRFDDIKNKHQRLLFALASYNIGYGHVRDAQKLAEERGLDKNSWASLKQVLPLLAVRKFYKTTEHGYARGREPVKYVEQILSYYDILKQKAKTSYFDFGG